MDNPISNCRRSFYGLSSSGMCYPGLSSEAKSYMWKTVCSPVLTYGLECVYLNKTGINKLESLQGRCGCGLLNRAHGLLNRAHGLLSHAHGLHGSIIIFHMSPLGLHTLKRLPGFLNNRITLTC